MSSLFFHQNLRGDAARAFEDVAYLKGDLGCLKFGVTSEEFLFRKFQIFPDEAIVVCKKFDRSRSDMTEKLASPDAIRNFLALNCLPLIAECTNDVTGETFSQTYLRWTHRRKIN